MPPPILTKEEIQANQQRREHVKNFIQIFLKTNNSEPKDAEVKAHLDFRSSSDTEKLDWVDAEVTNTPFVMNIGAVIEVTCIMVCNPLEWSALPMCPDSKIRSSLKDCAVPFYELMFIRVSLWLPFFLF